MKERVLVVGGAGYVGGHLVDRLLKQDDFILTTVYDSLLYEDRYLKDVDFIRGDVRDKEKLGCVIRNYHTIVWLAALVGDGACAVDPKLTEEINFESVKWLVDNFNGRIIFMSTCSVYGKSDDILDEESPTNPLSVYAETKLKAEQYIRDNHENCLIFRLGTLYGVSDEHSRIRLDLVVNVLTKKAVEEKKMTVFGGEQWRPILHVKDVGSIIDYAINRPTINGLYNLVDENITIKSLAMRIAETLNGCNIFYQDMMFEDMRNYRVSGNKMKNEIACTPLIDLETGVHEIREVIFAKRLFDPNSSVYSNVAYVKEKVEEIR